MPSPLDAAPPTPDSTGAPPAPAAAQQPSAKDVIRQRILDKQRANKDASSATNQSAAKPRARSSKKDKDGGGGGGAKKTSAKDKDDWKIGYRKHLDKLPVLAPKPPLSGITPTITLPPNGESGHYAHHHAAP